MQTSPLRETTVSISTFSPRLTPNASITCAWQNVISTNVNAPNGEVVGRFAYWTDIESTKVNVNLAEMRTTSSPTITSDPLMNQSVPGDVDLRALELPFYENPGFDFWNIFKCALLST